MKFSRALVKIEGSVVTIRPLSDDFVFPEKVSHLSEVFPDWKKAGNLIFEPNEGTLKFDELVYKILPTKDDEEQTTGLGLSVMFYGPTIINRYHRFYNFSFDIDYSYKKTDERK